MSSGIECIDSSPCLDKSFPMSLSIMKDYQEMYFHFNHMLPQLKYLTEEMISYYRNSGIQKMRHEEVKVGEFYANSAFDTNVFQLARVQVTKIICQDTIQVFCVDYGCKCIVSSEFLRKLPPEHMEKPRMAIKARFHVIPPNGIDYEVRAHMNKFLLNNTNTIVTFEELDCEGVASVTIKVGKRDVFDIVLEQIEKVEKKNKLNREAKLHLVEKKPKKTDKANLNVHSKIPDLLEPGFSPSSLPIPSVTEEVPWHTKVQERLRTDFIPPEIPNQLPPNELRRAAQNATLLPPSRPIMITPPQMFAYNNTMLLPTSQINPYILQLQAMNLLKFHAEQYLFWWNTLQNSMLPPGTYLNPTAYVQRMQSLLQIPTVTPQNPSYSHQTATYPEQNVGYSTTVPPQNVGSTANSPTQNLSSNVTSPDLQYLYSSAASPRQNVCSSANTPEQNVNFKPEPSAMNSPACHGHSPNQNLNAVSQQNGLGFVNSSARKPEKNEYTTAASPQRDVFSPASSPEQNVFPASGPNAASSPAISLVAPHEFRQAHLSQQNNRSSLTSPQGKMYPDTTSSQENVFVGTFSEQMTASRTASPASPRKELHPTVASPQPKSNNNSILDALEEARSLMSHQKEPIPDKTGNSGLPHTTRAIPFEKLILKRRAAAAEASSSPSTSFARPHETESVVNFTNNSLPTKPMPQSTRALQQTLVLPDEFSPWERRENRPTGRQANDEWPWEFRYPPPPLPPVSPIAPFALDSPPCSHTTACSPGLNFCDESSNSRKNCAQDDDGTWGETFERFSNASPFNVGNVVPSKFSPHPPGWETPCNDELPNACSDVDVLLPKLSLLTNDNDGDDTMSDDFISVSSSNGSLGSLPDLPDVCGNFVASDVPPRPPQH